MGIKNTKYLIILFLVGLVSIPLIYYGIVGKSILGLFREETVSPAIKPAAPPKVTVEIQRSGKEDVLVIRWDNIPNKTARIKIYRAKAGTTDWVLWKIIDLANIAAGGGAGGGGVGGAPGAGGGILSGVGGDIDSFIGNAENGSFSISLGAPNENNEEYVYYVQAVVPAGSETSVGTGADTGAGAGTGTGGESTEEILWTSPVTAPVVVTSTPSTPIAPPPTTGTGTPPPTPPSTTQPTSTATSTTPSQPTSSPPAPPPPPPPPTTPSGIPYYNPQGGISGYGQPQSGNFWVQHTDNKIDIGWQNLPVSTTGFVVSRSQGQNGPWTQILTQQNPPTTGGPYSIKILDHTLYEPYYYKMDVYTQSGIMATYGPAYLPALGQ